MKQVLITNTVAMNGGDAAILESLVGLLRLERPGISITIYDSDPEGASRVLPAEHFRRIFFKRFLDRRGFFSRPMNLVGTKRIEAALFFLLRGWRSIGLVLLRRQERGYLAELGRADLIVSTGGTYLVPTYSVEPRLMELELAAVSGTPFILFTQSLGPFTGGIHRRTTRVLTRAQRIMVRDEKSRRHLADIGVPSAMCSVHPDVVFALAKEKRRHPPPTGPRVAISVRQWVMESAAWERYLDAIAAGVDVIVRGHSGTVTFVSTCQGSEDYWTDDSDVARTIIESLPEQIKPSISLVSDRLTTEELLKIYGDHDAVIATRMHAAIMALCSGTPVLPIAYEFKTNELFEQLGLREWVTSIHKISPERFPETVARFLSHTESLADALAPRIAEMKARALASVEPLLRSLDNPTGRPK